MCCYIHALEVLRMLSRQGLQWNGVTAWDNAKNQYYYGMQKTTQKLSMKSILLCII